MLKNLPDVCKHLGVKEETNKELSRKVYDKTDLGAWAEVVERPKYITKVETWSVTYCKMSWGWRVREVTRDAQVVSQRKAPKEVKGFFLLGKVYAWHRRAYFGDLCTERKGDPENFVLTEKLEVRYQDGTELVFRVGSVVKTVEVVLPATPDQIDAALREVGQDDGITGATS